MQGLDWIVTETGQCQPCLIPKAWHLLEDPYRFYRFLTGIEDVLRKAADEKSCLPELHTLVRKLILNCYWVQTQKPEPSQDGGITVLNLYDEIGFPFTVQTVTFTPHFVSTIHNHGTWGAVAVLKGREKNKFWRRIPHAHSDKIECVGEVILEPGDILSLTPDAIHSVEAIAEEPTITFNIYGETYHKARFEFDAIAGTAKNY
ncbi:MAG: cupin [Spirulina sp.]